MKSKIRNHRLKSSTDDEMANLGYYFTSSSSSNLSPLAPPFTVERSNPNPNKLNSTPYLDSNYTAKSDGSTSNTSIWPQFHSAQGLVADSITDANSTLGPHYYDNMNSGIESGLDHDIQQLFGAKLTPSDLINSLDPRGSTSHPNLMVSAGTYNRLTHPNPTDSPITYNRFTHPNPINSASNWSSMNSSVKLGSEPPVNKSDGHLFGVKRSPQPKTCNFGDDDDYLLPSRNSFRDYGPAQVDYGIGLSGSATYSKQVDGSQGKEDYMFGGVSDIARENNIGTSIIGKSHNISFSATNHGIVPSGFSDERMITWNGHTSYSETRPIMLDFSSGYTSPSITKASPSIVIKPSVTISPFPAKGAVSTKGLESGSTSICNSNDVPFRLKPLKEKGFEAKDSCITSNQLSNQRDASSKMSTDGRLNFEFKASSNIEVPNINSTKDVKSAANVSEQQNSCEDSPCWKGAPARFSSSGSSSDAESSQHPMKKQQKTNAQEPKMKSLLTDGVENKSMHVSVRDADNLVTAESLDINVFVKALSNLSELLLLHCSKDECVLKEQDHKALAHVIHNLDVCISRKNQQAVPAQINDEKNNDNSGKNIVELQSASLRDHDLPKNYNMIQKIKMLLDDNLECKEDDYRPSDSLLYKNLWLETEAELCTLSYRARYDRIKREMGKSKASVPDVSEVASDIKKISTSNLSPTAPELMHEAAGSKISNTHEQNPSLQSVNDHNDDVENSVMARFNILKHRQESNPLNMEEKKLDHVDEASGNEIQSSEVAEESHWQHLLGKDDGVVMHSHGNQKSHYSLAMGAKNVEHAVMARLNILKSRGESVPLNVEWQVLADGARSEVSDKESQSYGIVGPHSQHLAGKEEVTLGYAGGTNLMHNHFNSGSYTTHGASSDWEYVMKG